MFSVSSFHKNSRIDGNPVKNENGKGRSIKTHRAQSFQTYNNKKHQQQPPQQDFISTYQSDEMNSIKLGILCLLFSGISTPCSIRR